MIDALNLMVAQLRGAWRYRWPAVLVMWIVAAAGWAAIAAIPNTYEARARIYVDSESVLKPLLSGLAVGTDVTTQAATVSRLILSKPNLERVARETGLALRAQNPQDLERIVQSLSARAQIGASPYDQSLFTITFQDNDRTMAQRVVRTVLIAFMEDTLGMKRADSDEAQAFLMNQIREYERRLRDAEERLAEFKRKNVGLMPGQSGDYYARLEAAQTALAAAETELRTATDKRDELMRQLEGEEPTVGLSATSSSDSAGAGTTLDMQISGYRAKLDALLVQYTDKHPEVVALKETIARLEAQRDKEAEAHRQMGGGMRPSTGVNALNINPVYQSMRIALSQTELQLVELKNKAANAQADVAKLRGMVNTVPEVEAELARLSRDYEVNRAQHQQLLQRLESARLSEEVSLAKRETRFKIVEAPAVPLLPKWPNRPLLNAGVLFAAVAAGLLLALIMHQINPVFALRSELETSTGLPVFGTVTFAPDAALARLVRRQPLLIGASMLLLGIACAAATIASNWLLLPHPGGPG